MLNCWRRAWGPVLAALLLIGALVMVAAPGVAAAGMLLDASLGDVKPEDKAVIAQPRPVQLLFVFRTKGAPNGKATKFLKETVFETVRSSGLFSEVSEGPVEGGAVLSVGIDNVIQPKEINAAAAKGAVTGATLFLAGSNIRDNYECTVEYVPAPGSPTITRTAHHAVVTQLGLINSAPKDAVKVGSAKDTIFAMARQIVSNPLQAAAHDPGFVPGQAPAASSAAPVDAAQPASPAPEAQPPAETAPAAQPAAAATPAPTTP